MNLTHFAVTRIQVTITLLLCIVLGGILAYKGLPKAEDPGFTIRTVSIVTAFPGASPRRVEQLVSAPLEESLQQIPELTTIKSTSRSGVSIVIVEIDDELFDLQPIYADIRTAVDDVQDDLPDDARDSEVETDVATVFGVVYALTSEGFTHVETVRAAQGVKDAMLLLPEASKVELFGDQQRRVALRYDHAKLARMGLTPNALVGLLQTTNIVTPGGLLTVGPEVLSIEPSGSFERVEDIASMLVTLPSGALVSLSDVVDVSDELATPADPRAFHNGQDAVFIGVSQRSGGNSELFGVQARQMAAQLAADLPLGLELTEVNFQPDDVQTKIDSFVTSLAQSVGIVFVVMMLFLGARTGLIVASLIPTVICATFLLMSGFSIGIDQMSLAALLIALGMLVDNAIVIAENTMVRLQQGASAIDATVGAASELRIPLLVSSLTTCAAFLPVYLAPGGASEFVGPIFKVVTIALLASWVLATTTLPMICVLFLKVDASKEPSYDTAGYQVYRRSVRAVLDYRWTALAGSVLALALAIWGLGFVRVAFFPPSEKPAFTANIELPAGTDEAEAMRTLVAVHAYVDEELAAEDGPGVTSYASMQGDALPRFSLTYKGPDKAAGSLSLLLQTNDRARMEGWAGDLERWVEENVPGARVSARPLVLGPGGSAPISVELVSTDEAMLLRALSEATDHLRQTPGARNISDSWGPRTKKIEVRVDPTRARLAGVTHQDVALSLLTSLSGLEATELRQGEDVIPIELIAKGSDQLDLPGLRNLTVFGQKGSVALHQVGDIDLVWDFGLIKRNRRQRAIEVSAWPSPGASAADIQDDFVDWAKAQDWPGVSVSASGELADSAEANAGLMSTLPMVAMIITLLLMFQFNDARKTFINLAVLPFSLVGVTIGLLLFDSYIGFITLLAIISLFGIVLNNGNVLLDRIQIELDAGRGPLDAVVEASVQRLRPILLTTATTVTGLIPLYFGGGPMFEPLAVTLMVGLLFGTVLTLGLVPVMYAVLFRVPRPVPPTAALSEGRAPAR